MDSLQIRNTFRIRDTSNRKRSRGSQRVKYVTFNRLGACGTVKNRDILNPKDDSESQRAQDSESLIVWVLRASVRSLTSRTWEFFDRIRQRPPTGSQTECPIRTIFFLNRSQDPGLHLFYRHYMSMKRFFRTVNGLAVVIYRNLTRVTPLLWSS